MKATEAANTRHCRKVVCARSLDAGYGPDPNEEPGVQGERRSHGPR